MWFYSLYIYVEFSKGFTIKIIFLPFKKKPHPLYPIYLKVLESFIFAATMLVLFGVCNLWSQILESAELILELASPQDLTNLHVSMAS